MASDFRNRSEESPNDMQINCTFNNTKCLGENAIDALQLRHAPLLNTDFLVAIVYITIMSVLLLVGTFGNLCVIGTSLCKNAVNKMGRAFIINLALADLCVSSIADPLCILGVVKGEKYFNDKLELCHFVASMCLTACLSAFMSLTMLTINRYVYLCHNNVYHRLYNRITTAILCFMCWVIAFLFELPNFIGWGGHYFDRKSHQCIWNRTASFSYSLFVSVGLIGGPLLLMGICNILTFFEVWKRKRDIYKLDTDNHFPSLRAWNDTVRTSQMLLVIFTVFVVCWTPYATVVAVDVGDRLSMKIHLFVTMIAHVHSSCNCIIYMIMNRGFRKAVRNMLPCSCKIESSTKQKTSTLNTVSK